MAQTLINSDGLAPGCITRPKLNTTLAGSGVIAKVISGAGISITQTGVDGGTGDVTISAASSLSALPTNGWFVPSSNTLGAATNDTQWLTLSATGNLTFAVPAGGGAPIQATGAAYSVAATLNGAASPGGGVLALQGNYTGAGIAPLAALADTGNTNGVSVLLIGNGATTPSKTIRVVGGALQVLNNAGTVLSTLGDDGGMQLGTPTGGDLGAGTLNVAGALYANGVIFGPALNMQIWATPGSYTWTKPAGNPQWTEVYVIPGGGGGGSGSIVGSGTLASGGSGGGGAAINIPAKFQTSSLAATVAVTVGAGGTGGASVTASGAGNPGTAGGASTFGTLVMPGYGGAGAGGQVSSNSGGGGGGTPMNQYGSAASGTSTAGGAGGTFGVAGGYGSSGAGSFFYGAGGGGGVAGSAGGSGGQSGIGATGGGAGGGIGSAPVASVGGNAQGNALVTTSLTGGAIGTNGANGLTPLGLAPGQGGSGGGSSITGNGGNGGTGGRGAGGGGGGSVLNGHTSGAGGNGGPGLVVIVTSF